jgi:eukaryotic-like serine/threonine-protein kinase
MPLSSGFSLGPYEIVSPLGAGGMGEVYKARDVRLDRTVAIKVLPAQVFSDPELKQRFEREARAISALQHPNICTLHDIGSENGIDYLVMEYLEGESLADRLAKGPLPLDQVLRYGAELADALDKAHRHGIVHRDLKPGNVVLTRSGAKLLDFGLAKPGLVTRGVSRMAAAMTEATVSKPLTAEGSIVGTFEYMSPEQLQGAQADARSDIFSLGSVLYEMATGRRAFEGKSQISVMSAILEKEPAPISSVRPLTPAGFEHVVTTCLAKDPEDRWQSARDVQSALKFLARPQSESALTLGGRRLVSSRWLAASIALLVVVVTGIGFFAARPSRERQVLRFNVSAPSDAFFGNGMALSPDGKQIVVVSEKDGGGELVVRSLDALQSHSLAGTKNGHLPFWSPDGRSIGFFAEGKLKKIELASGAVQSLADTNEARGGTWSEAGIVYSPTPSTALYFIPAGGGTPVEITQLDTDKGITHRWPYFLPDGRHFLYASRGTLGGRWTILVGSLDRMKPVQLLSADSGAIFAQPGYLLFVHGNTLLAQLFNPRTFKLSGDTTALVEGMQPEGENGATGFVSLAAAQNVLSFHGALNSRAQLQWFDRGGKSLDAAKHDGEFANPALSPEGRRVAVDRFESATRQSAVWVLDTERGAFTLVSHGEGTTGSPVWSPDGNWLYYGRSAGSDLSRYHIVRMAANGTGSEETIFAGSGGYFPSDISRDGRYMLFVGLDQLATGGGTDVWLLPLSGEGKATKFIDSPAEEAQAVFSPDGRWVAYASNESGDSEVYVVSFPDKRVKIQLSTEGGGEPQWRDDGREIYYLGSDLRLRSVAVQPGADLRPGRPQLLADHWTAPVRRPDPHGGRSQFATRDGKKFLIIGRQRDSLREATIFVNWAATLGSK